jgi:hypothetical protein
MASVSPNPRLDGLLDQLAADLQPVRPLSDRPVQLALAVLLGCAAATVVAVLGMRSDVMAGQPDTMFLMRCGMLAVLALASVGTVLAQARPGVGFNRQGWKVAAAMAALFPLIGAVQALANPDHARAMLAMASGRQCLGYSLGIAALVAVPIVLHLRRGAPVAPERAGLLVGLSAGSLGALAYNFHCPFNSMVYIGLWYGAAITGAAIFGRLVVPRLIRW